MKLSWTFYPKGEAAITLTVLYVPELDGKAVGGGGILDVDQNTAYVDWATYKRFDDSSVENRKDAYNRLTRIDGDIGEAAFAGTAEVKVALSRLIKPGAR